MATYFFMVTETTFVNTSSHVSEIVEVHSDILVDLLVVLVRVFDAIASSFLQEGLSIITVLVDEMTLARAAIGSQRS